MVVLSSGRPGIGLWVIPDDGDVAKPWDFYNIATEHNKLVDADPDLPASWQYDSIMERIVNVSSPGYGPSGPETTSYNGMAEIEPNVVLLAYDRLANGWNGPPGPYGEVDTVFALRIEFARVPRT